MRNSAGTVVSGMAPALRSLSHRPYPVDRALRAGYIRQLPAEEQAEFAIEIARLEEEEAKQLAAEQ
jgi:hypothetical protein